MAPRGIIPKTYPVERSMVNRGQLTSFLSARELTDQIDRHGQHLLGLALDMPLLGDERDGVTG